MSTTREDLQHRRLQPMSTSLPLTCVRRVIYRPLTRGVTVCRTTPGRNQVCWSAANV
jgi:hypothetical protein